jgi:hypothetical protein
MQWLPEPLPPRGKFAWDGVVGGHPWRSRARAATASRNKIHVEGLASPASGPWPPKDRIPNFENLGMRLTWLTASAVSVPAHASWASMQEQGVKGVVFARTHDESGRSWDTFNSLEFLFSCLQERLRASASAEFISFSPCRASNAARENDVGS